MGHKYGLSTRDQSGGERVGQDGIDIKEANFINSA